MTLRKENNDSLLDCIEKKKKILAIFKYENVHNFSEIIIYELPENYFSDSTILFYLCKKKILNSFRLGNILNFHLLLFPHFISCNFLWGYIFQTSCVLLKYAKKCQWFALNKVLLVQRQFSCPLQNSSK